jgi:hypothetical protein
VLSTGIARRSHRAWAPARLIFLLENKVPPFDSSSKIDKEKTGQESFFVKSRDDNAEHVVLPEY